MKKNSNPYWYKLIKLLKSKGKITTGLTIPYLHGAYKILGIEFKNISELIKEVHNTPIDKYPVIQKCYQIHQHVVMVEKKEVCHKTYLKDVKLKNSNNDNFLFISTNTDLGKTLNKVCLNLESIYSKPIKNGNYSWSNSSVEWKPFSGEEVELILSIKKANPIKK